MINLKLIHILILCLSGVIGFTGSIARPVASAQDIKRIASNPQEEIKGISFIGDMILIDQKEVATTTEVVDILESLGSMESEETIEVEVIEEPIVEVSEVVDTTDVVEDIIEDEPYSVYGEWLLEVSYYCACYDCTQNGDGQTASGYYAQEGVTIAAPPSIPFGTSVYIENVGNFIVQDRGEYIQEIYHVSGQRAMRVDIYLDDHYDCLSRGRHYEYGYFSEY